jgi:hypothetical protein
LARPRWRDFLVWQGAEAIYWIMIWLHLAGFAAGDTAGRFYHGAVFLHIAATLYLAVLVVRDILHPEHDPVRQTGDDDPLFPWAESPDRTHRLDPGGTRSSRASEVVS